MRLRRACAATAMAVIGFLAMQAPDARAAATGRIGDQHAAVRLIEAEQATGAMSKVDAGLQIRLAPGRHAYWRTPDAAGIPASIAWAGSRNLRSATLSWRAPRRFPLEGLQTYGYETGMVLPRAPEAWATPLARHGAELWRPFDRTAIAAEVARGRIVFVDVTAVWCLVCEVNELTVLDRDPVAARLRTPGVVAMRADWTRPSPATTACLRSFGRYGVPLDVAYGLGAPQGAKLPDLLTADAMMHAFAAAVRQVAARRRDG